MCGISGILSSSPEPAPLAAIAKGMADAQAHRGPDDSGLWAEGPVALSHRRLSIIDLSEGGHQPMVSADGRYVMVFNGEIYNYRELRAQLDYPFRTGSDTEVLLAAYARWGAACLDRLYGMFAFAVWDRQEQSLFLARDRMGVKPLYYYSGKEVFCFASELRSILASGQVRPEIEPAALLEYLRFQTVYAPATLIKDLRLLPAGHWLEIKDGKTELREWWSPEKNMRREERSPEATRKAVREALRAAVARRLVADVPFGAFLSGGIDSSAVVGLMAEVSAQPVHTFTVSFDESSYSEAPYAAEIARRFRTEHTDIRLSPEHFLELLPDALAAMDHPSGDGPNTYVVSKAAKAAGISMALTGLGGDELFAGYDHFKRLYRLQNMGWLNAIPRPLRQAAGRTLETLRPGIPSQKIAALLAAPQIDLAHAYPLQRQVLLERQIKQVVFSDQFSVLSSQFAPSPLSTLHSPLLSQISLLEFQTYLQHTLLRDADQMSMAHALELRVPFLDHDLVELVLGISDDLKYPHRPKQLLVASLGDLLPESVWRRPKMGFTLPFAQWMKRELRPFCEERIAYLGATPFFREEGLQSLWRDFLAGKPGVTWARLWVLVVLGDWVKKNISPLRRYERDV